MLETEENRTKFVLGILFFIVVVLIDFMFVSTERLTVTQILLSNLVTFIIVGIIVATVNWISRGK